MLLFDGTGQHDDFTSALGDECEALLRGANFGEVAKQAANAADLDAQAGTVRFVDKLGFECSCHEHVSRYVSGPRFC